MCGGAAQFDTPGAFYVLDGCNWGEWEGGHSTVTRYASQGRGCQTRKGCVTWSWRRGGAPG